MQVFMKEDDLEVVTKTRGHCPHRKKSGGLGRKTFLYRENCACFELKGRKRLVIYKLWQNGI